MTNMRFAFGSPDTSLLWDLRNILTVMRALGEKIATCKSILVARTARKTQKIGTGLLSEINLDLHGNNVRRLAASSTMCSIYNIGYGI